jgi:SAM-dependent methyltransferase
MNEESHWNKIGDNYNNEIFDVFASDKEGLLRKYFNRHANKKFTAMDFGCGNGKAFAYLSPAFKEVIAVDISHNLIGQATKRPYDNITFAQRDLSKAKIALPKVDFLFSCNVIMLPEIERNYAMLRNVKNSLKKGGSAVLVLPSTESILFSAWRLMDWYGREGTNVKDISKDELAYFKGGKLDILRGIFYVDGVPIKHYLESEIEVILNQAKLNVTAIEKIRYDWDTEFDSPPKWMKAPYPWDWLVECTS